MTLYYYDSSSKVIFWNFTLVRITRSQVSDSGAYTCLASNRAGVDSRHYNLQVHGESDGRSDKYITKTICGKSYWGNHGSESYPFSLAQSLLVWMEQGALKR